MRALSSGCTRHGKALRGLMAVDKTTGDNVTKTARPPNFQGRFGRMFPPLGGFSATKFGKTEKESRDALNTLGKMMTALPDKAKDGKDGEESGIPTLYTYFGQFIDHDITFDPMTTLVAASDPDALTDFRTAALDLDNVYGRGPDDQPYMYDNSGKKFLLGNPLDNGAFDLQRNNANPARALIGDPRNDENSIISQFQGLMLRFHNRVADNDPDAKFEVLQQRVRWHYQWVIVNDFLSRIISQSVLDGLKTDGQYDPGKLRFYTVGKSPIMPVEFSAAAYRLGHSMIRPGYRMNDATLLPIFPTETDPGGPSLGLTGFRAMARDTGIDWRRFIDIGPPREIGGEDDPATPEMKKRLQFAYRLDTSLVNPLGNLPPSVAPDAPPSLATRNLLRGFELGLPTGQEVADFMKVRKLEDKEIIIGKAGVKPGDGEPVPTPISDIKELEPFRGKCPLWTYILAEAFYYGRRDTIPVTNFNNPDPKFDGTLFTPQLGPVGGRIVAEVFLGMLFSDPNSYLSCDKKWIPTIGKAKENFKLKDIVAYALGLDV